MCIIIHFSPCKANDNCVRDCCVVLAFQCAKRQVGTVRGRRIFNVIIVVQLAEQSSELLMKKPKVRGNKQFIGTVIVEY